MNKFKVVVGIPAYNSEKNITNLVNTIFSQKEEMFTLEQIIVFADNCTDNTVSMLHKIKNKRLRIIDNKNRGGFAFGVKSIIELFKGDLLILFNDDILISDLNLLNKLVKPFSDDVNIGLLCGNPQPLPPLSFIDKAMATRLKASEILSNKVNNGSNIFSCDGKILVMSKGFINKLTIPNNLTLMGNVDAYLYFTCLKNNFKYKFVPNAFVKYRNPTSLNDYKRWIGRNNSNRSLLLKQFGDIVKREYTKPKFLFLYATVSEAIKNPLGSIFILLVEPLIIPITNAYKNNFNAKWDIVKSTKEL